MSTFTNVPLTPGTLTTLNGTAGTSANQNPFDDEIHIYRGPEVTSDDESCKKSKSRFSTATSATMCPPGGDDFSNQEKGDITRPLRPIVKESRFSDKQLAYLMSFQRILAYSIILGLQVAISARDGDIGEGIACTVAFAVVIEVAMSCVRSIGPTQPGGIFLYIVWMIVASSLMAAGYVVMNRRVNVMEETVMKNILDAAKGGPENLDVRRDVARACLGMAMKKGN